MNLILVSKHGVTRTLRLTGFRVLLLVLCLVGMPVFLGGASYWFNQWLDAPVFSEEIAHRWLEETRQNQQALLETRKQVDEQLKALTVRMAAMQARLVRLDALGERLAEISDIHSDEFDFGSDPALGGPEGWDLDEEAFARPSFAKALDKMAEEIDRREAQLSVLERLLANEKREEDVFLAGRPIKRGWLSSRFGTRTDPFTGRLAIHKGVDFAGKQGSDIVATGAGVVTWAGKRYGYGLMVEINHGDGYSTRYAHAQELLVSVGDIVRRGQVVALMGSSGRSTGPHVHYEVLKNGRQVDPADYLYRRASR